MTIILAKMKALKERSNQYETIGIKYKAEMMSGRFIDGMKTKLFAVAIWPLCYHRDIKTQPSRNWLNFESVQTGDLQMRPYFKAKTHRHWNIS